MKSRLYKSSTDKKISGLCAGIADYFDIDPTLVRLATVVLGFAYGWGLVLYLIGWIVVPVNPNVDNNSNETNSTNINNN